jgi:hypothetical protein
MGRNSGSSGGGSRGGLQPGDSTYKGKIDGVETLKNIKDPQVYKAVGEAISRYHSVLGVRQKEIKLANLTPGTLGVHVTQNGKSAGIYLNKSTFNQAKAKIVAQERKGYDSGWSTRTNKPIAHVVTHELGHATWNAHLTTSNAIAAGPSVQKLYAKWKKDKSKKGYGKYARTNVSEFFAETVTKAVHGEADKYTRAVKAIIKKYKL